MKKYIISVLLLLSVALCFGEDNKSPYEAFTFPLGTPKLFIETKFDAVENKEIKDDIITIITNEETENYIFKKVGFMFNEEGRLYGQKLVVSIKDNENFNYQMAGVIREDQELYDLYFYSIEHTEVCDFLYFRNKIAKDIQFSYVILPSMSSFIRQVSLITE